MEPAKTRMTAVLQQGPAYRAESWQRPVGCSEASTPVEKSEGKVFVVRACRGRKKSEKPDIMAIFNRCGQARDNAVVWHFNVFDTQRSMRM